MFSYGLGLGGKGLGDFPANYVRLPEFISFQLFQRLSLLKIRDLAGKPAGFTVLDTELGVLVAPLKPPDVHDCIPEEFWVDQVDL